MEIKYLKIDEIKPYEKNPRKNDGAVEYVANSIKEFGFKVPVVVDRNNVIVAGHTRYKASIKLGLNEIPCIVADDLTDKQIKAFRLADNKVSEKAIWDYDFLSQEMSELELDFNFEDFGFDLFNKEDNTINGVDIEEKTPSTKSKEGKKIVCPCCSFEFEL